MQLCIPDLCTDSNVQLRTHAYVCTYLMGCEDALCVDDLCTDCDVSVYIHIYIHIHAYNVF